MELLSHRGLVETFYLRRVLISYSSFQMAWEVIKKKKVFMELPFDGSLPSEGQRIFILVE